MRDGLVEIIDSHNRRLFADKLDESTALWAAFRPSNDVHFFEITERLEHLLQLLFREGLWQHSNEKFVLSIKGSFRKAHL